MLLYDAHKRIDKGFTLIEMITVVIILGVLAAITAPNFLGMLNQTRVKDGLGQVEGAIREAQKLALRRGKSCTIKFTTSGAGSSVVEVSPGSEGCLLNKRELSSSVFFSLLDSSTGTLDLIDSSNEIELTFSSKGNPSVEVIMVVSHSGTNTQKCIQIEGLLGNILTGNYNTADNECDAQ